MIKLENLLIAFYGVTTVAVFLTMISIGGLFDSFNAVFFREVSFLISPYSLKSSLTIPLFRLYNIHLFLFSVVLLLRLRNIFARLGALYLSLSAVMSVALIRFPLDPLGISQSLSGSSHILIVLITVVYIAAALALFGYGFKSSKRFHLLSVYSSEVSLLFLAASFITAVFALLSMPAYVGLFQKLPIAAFLGWIVLTSFLIVKSDRRLKYGINRKGSTGKNRTNR
jgi:hypothetical protein